MEDVMRRLIGFAAVAFALASPLAQAQAQDEKIAQAVLPLPDDLRAEATVVTYDPATGDRIVLRQGTSFIECQPKSPKDGFTRCYNKSSAPRRDMEAKLRAQKKSDKEVTDAIAEAMKDGRLKPPAWGTMSYRLSSDEGRIKLLWVMSVPNATPEQVGVSTVSQRDAALKGQGKPWLMLSGTPGAHIMIPINPGPAGGTK
jgi:hypothetical protein